MPADRSTVTPRAGLESEALSLYRRVMRAIHVRASASWLQLDLTIAQLKGLMALAEHEPQAIGELAGALGVTQPAASLLADRLVQAGYIERFEDTADRRRTLVRLNRPGRRLIQSLRDGGRAALQPWIEDLSTDELTSLVSGLQAVVDRAERTATTKASDA